MNNVFDSALIEKYSAQGPRYTSYPTAVEFHDGVDGKRFAELVSDSNRSRRDISLYAHIPFCDTLCYYCACNKVVTKKRALTSPYLAHIEKEIEQVSRLIDSDRRVVQLHWGGGTPTYLAVDEQWQLMEMFQKHFRFAGDDEGEFSIEIDPRTVTVDGIKALREMGFNRLSFGVQDFDEQVQVAVNRVQSTEETQLAIETGRELGFHSISVDLIYGLPLQTTQSFARTLDKIIALSPDRIAVFNYAHLPHIFAAQRKIKDGILPSAQRKLNLLELSIRKLMEAGYVFIGLDHFAKPDDSLVKHQNARTLYRNFQGYSTFSECDLFGFGVSAISQVGDSYSQNAKDSETYYRMLEADAFPTVRGIELNADDKIRRKVITEIMCNMAIDWDALSAVLAIDARDYFADEIQRLQPLHDDGLLVLDRAGFTVTAPGRLLIRNIAMLFDRYLPKASKKTFSKVI